MTIDPLKKKSEDEMQDERKATSHLLKAIEQDRAVLAANKAKEDALLASIGDGIIGTDKEGNITVMNTAAREILGWTPAEVMGKNLFEIVVVEDEQGRTILKNKQSVSAVFASGNSVKIDTTYLAKDEKKIPVAINITPIQLEGEIIGTVNVFRDITEEQELDRAKSEFISLASHQLRGPITAMLWNLEMLISGSKGPITEEQKKGLEVVYGSAKNMDELVGGFLNVAKMESNRFDIETGEVDMIAMANSVFAMLEHQIADKKLRIEKKYDADIPHLNIGTKTARIILQNLITNAVKYTPESGAIEVVIKKAESGVVLSVKDNGCGIPGEAKSKIFTKLFRAKNALKLEPSGTGLGLYLVKSLVDKLGGKIWFESQEGVGSTFFVELHA